MPFTTFFTAVSAGYNTATNRFEIKGSPTCAANKSNLLQSGLIVRAQGEAATFATPNTRRQLVSDPTLAKGPVGNG